MAQLKRQLFLSYFYNLLSSDANFHVKLFNIDDKYMYIATCIHSFQYMYVDNRNSAILIIDFKNVVVFVQN